MEQFLFYSNEYPIEPLCRALKAAGIASTVTGSLQEWEHLSGIRDWAMRIIAGDGLMPENLRGVTVLVNKPKKEFAGKGAQVYTGVVRASTLLRASRMGAVVARESDEIVCGNLLLSLDEKIAWWQGEQLLLTPRQFNLLRLLASNPERIFTRNELWESGWGLSDYPESNAIDAHIRRLRHKIPKGLANCIVSAYGIGYRFVPNNRVAKRAKKKPVLPNALLETPRE